MTRLTVGRTYKGLWEPNAMCVVVARRKYRVCLLWLTTSGNRSMGDVAGTAEWADRQSAEAYLKEL